MARQEDEARLLLLRVSARVSSRGGPSERRRVFWTKARALLASDLCVNSPSTQYPVFPTSALLPRLFRSTSSKGDCCRLHRAGCRT
jgi:hypothetical protein